MPASPRTWSFLVGLGSLACSAHLQGEDEDEPQAHAGSSSSAGSTSQPGGSGGSAQAGGGSGGSQSQSAGAGSGGQPTGTPNPEPEPLPTGDGFQVDGVCYPRCTDPAFVDADGWGWQSEQTCVQPGSATANRGLACGAELPPPMVEGPVGGGTCPEQGSYSCPSGAWCGCLVVPGLGQNKVALIEAGADQYMLAAAMLETTNMSSASYSYGDGKWGDSFNAGVTKQNWLMMRHGHAAWTGLDTEDYATAAALNSSLALDVQVFKECRAHYGDQWWAGHRAGQSGLDGSHDWNDINRFKGAMDWTHGMIANHLQDDVRFWVDLPAI